jgi:hypothetical protein
MADLFHREKAAAWSQKPKPASSERTEENDLSIVVLCILDGLPRRSQKIQAMYFAASGGWK